MRNRLFRMLLLLSGAVALSFTPALAQGRGHGQNNEKKDHKEERWQEREHGRGHGRNHHEDHRDRLRFHNGARGEIVSYYRAYYREHRHHLPPGLARRGHLPPGLARQLRRNGRLPYGLRKRIVWFPAQLDRRLGPLPYGYRRCWVADNVLIVNRKTFAILDIIRDVAILNH